MATADANWRDLITPEIEELTNAADRALSRMPVDVPLDFSVDDLAALSIARVANPSATLWDVMDDVGEQGALQLHLTGSSVVDHAVSAQRFTSFVSHLAASVAETAKSLTHQKRRSNRIMIGAVQPASLAFELRAPEVHVSRSQGVVTEHSVSSVDSEALRMVTTVLATAREDDEALDSAVEALPLSARAKLHSAMDQVAHEQWGIDGALRQGDFSPLRLEVSLPAIARVRYALETAVETREHRQVVAEISGFRREENVVWLAPLDGSKRFPASATDLSVMRAVREAAAVEGTIIAAELTVVTRPSQGNGASLRTSRTLDRFTVVAEQKRVDFYDL